MGIRPRPEGRIVSRNRIDLRRLRDVTARPALYAGRERSFWTDPYVARHVLEAHLDPHTDDATRRPEHIAATVETVLEHMRRTGRHDPFFTAGNLPPGEAPRILDLACGPGLYATQFAARGMLVTGIDFSETVLEYARRSARTEGLSVDYRCEDFTVTAFGGPWDVITLIYGEFGTIAEQERHEFLMKAYDALAPGGLLVFDVFTEAYARRNRSKDDWYVGSRDGFWQSGGHLVLERHYFYVNASASVTQYTIVGPDGGYRQFHVWWRHFDREEITTLVEAAGFQIDGVYPSLWKQEPDRPGEWIGVYARKLA